MTIKELAETIARIGGTTVEWDTSKPNGDAKRIMDMTRAKSYGFECQVSLEEGLHETFEFYKKYGDKFGRHEAFA